MAVACCTLDGGICLPQCAARQTRADLLPCRHMWSDWSVPRPLVALPAASLSSSFFPSTQESALESRLAVIHGGGTVNEIKDDNKSSRFINEMGEIQESVP